VAVPGVGCSDFPQRGDSALIAFTLRRLLALIPTLLVITAITFFMGFAAPGDPISTVLGERASTAQVAALKAQYGLDKPPLVQYFKFLGGALHGDFGRSYFYAGRPVIEMVGTGFGTSLKIGGVAALYAALFGMILGIIAAVNRNRWPDHLAMFFAVVGVSIPGFVLAIALMYLFGVHLKVLPTVGWGEPKHYILPVLVLGTRSAAFIARITRSAMLDVIGQDYVRTARAKGLSQRVVILKHAVKNALIPVITVLGTTMGSLITGTYIIETIFGIPGVGRISLDGIFQRDYQVIQVSTMLIATVFVLVNLVVDMMYGVVDPRIRYS
jgi:ABC-type dipeptide/oligopeptide/nickel transport system permease component